MKVSMMMKSFKVKRELSYFDLFSIKSILEQYSALGESEQAIQRIENRIKILAKSKYQLDSVLSNDSGFLKEVEATRVHKIIKLVQYHHFKVVLHAIPSRFKIPLHQHRNQISIIYNQKGELQVEQLTLSPIETRFKRVLKKSQACAGLFKFRNIHSLQSLLSPCIFISFHIANQRVNSFPKKQLLSFFTSCGLIFFPSYLLSSPVDIDTTIVDNKWVVKEDVVNNKMINKEVEQSIVSPSPPFKNEEPPVLLNKDIIKAHELREGDAVTQDLYEASEIYQQEAMKGNAIAQYWLGVMYLDGLGITDDTDEALRWVAESADQNYPPAEELLDIMLTTDEILDC